MRAGTYLARIEKELATNQGAHFAPFGQSLGLILGFWNDHPDHILGALQKWSDRIAEGSKPGWHEQNATLWSMLLALQDKGHDLDETIDQFLVLAQADRLSVGAALLHGGNTGGLRAAHLIQSADRQLNWLKRQGKADVFSIMVTANGYRIMSEAMGSSDTHTSQALMALFEAHIPPGLVIVSWSKDKPPVRPIHQWTSIVLERSNAPNRVLVLDWLLARGEDLDLTHEGKTPLERVVEEESRRSLEQQQEVIGELAARGARLPDHVQGRVRETWEQHPAGRRERLGEVLVQPTTKAPGPGRKM